MAVKNSIERKLEALESIQVVLRNSIQIEEKEAITKLNFINWIIGISSAGFILLISKFDLTSGSEEKIIAILVFISFFISLFSAVILHLFTHRLMKLVRFKSHGYEIQYLQLKNESNDLKNYDFGEGVSRALYRMLKLKDLKNFNVGDEFSRLWSQERIHSKIRNFLLYITLSFFSAQYLMIAYLFIEMLLL